MSPAPQPVILGFDTTLLAMSVALVEGGTALVNKTQHHVRNHAEMLPGMISSVLDEAGKTFTDISHIAVTTGPGGFSGLRAGLSHARGMGLALGCPVIGISTLEALAAGSQTDGPVIVAIPAGRGDIYIQAFRGDLNPLDTPRVLSPMVAAQAYAELNATLVGTGRQLIFDFLPPANRSVDGGNDFPLASDVVQLSIGRSASVHPPNPVYIRPPDAKLPDRAF